MPDQSSQGADSSHQLPVPGQNRLLFGILSYLGPLVIVSYLMDKDDSFVKFHIRQGLVLLSIQVVVWVLLSAVWTLWMFINLINLAVLVLSIIGIINVVNGKEAELPLVGQFAHYFKI